MKSFVASAIALVVAIPAVNAIVTADEHSAPPGDGPPVVKVGYYHDMTALGRLKLGTAPFINPGLLKHAAVAYKFDIDEVLRVASRWEAIIEKVRSGEVGVAEVNADGDYNLILPDGQDWFLFMKTLTKRKDDFVFVHSHNHLFDIPSTGTIVSWDAFDPLYVG